MLIKSDMNGLNKLATNAEDMHGTSQIKLSDLMTPEFIAGCSSYTDLEHLYNESGFKIESKKDFEVIPDGEWEEFITSNTSFDSWEHMQKEAMAAHVIKQLFKDL